MLEINIELVAMTAVVFLALIFILNQLLYKPMIKFIDQRNALIKSDEESAEKNTSDLGVYEAQIESILADARTQANKIKQEALATAKSLANNELNDKKAQLESEYAEFLDALQNQRSELKRELTLNLPELKTALEAKLARI